jgi:predicted alpha/beta superfamily hydrolase
MRALINSLIFFALLQPCAAHADEFDPSKLQGLGDTRYHQFESETLGHTLHLYVRVPEASAQDPNQRYPTVYLLDGGINFPLLSSYYHYLRLGEEVPEMLLVGISYGSDTFDGGNFRSSDFTAPSKEREWWGKAPTFQAVLEHELLPLIEAEYASDPEQRIIFGQSLAGQYVLYAALTRPEMFWGHIASNPALHSNLGYFLGWKGAGEMPVQATRLFVSEGEFNDSRFKQPAAEWIEYWSAPEREKPFILEVQTLSGQSHLSSVTAAFRQGLHWLFSEQKGTSPDTQ